MGSFGFPGLKVETWGTRHPAPVPFYTHSMRNEFTAVIERDGEWFVAWSPEIPGANGQGRSVEECRESLGAAIQLILEDRPEALETSS
jgi:predicted RNase H-like HicB family nuclease